MSYKCDGGHIRTALLSIMCILFGINILHLKRVSQIKSGSAEFGTLQCQNLKQALRDTDFCVSKGAQYFCTHLRNKLASVSVDEEMKLDSCLSDEESLVACRKGKYLCKDGATTMSGQSTSAGQNTRSQVLQCLAATSALKEGEFCVFKEVPYICTDTKPEFYLATNYDTLPCLDHIAANITCSEERFLCQKILSETEKIGGWAQYVH